MSPRSLFACYVFLSVVDFAATVFLVTNGYADEANPLICGFAARFSSFTLALGIYKLASLTAVSCLLRLVHRHNPVMSRALLGFANVLMLALGVWHVACIRMALAAA
ncbi:MAG TPA: DUF5658 family protein [Armatimonadota bacterium]